MRTVFGQLLKLTAPLKGEIALAVLLGTLTVAAGFGLMTTSAYLISFAGLHPSVAALGVAVVGVRFFGIARAVFRYLERYVSHRVTFRLLTRLRVWFYEALEPLAPARLLEQKYRSGDLLSRIVGDIETLQNFYLKVLAPPLVTALIGLGVWFFLGAYDLVFAFTFLGFYLLASIGVPLLVYRLSRTQGQKLVALRAELNVQLVDGIQGMAELIAFGQEDLQLARVQLLNRQLSKLEGRMAWVSGLSGALSNLLMNLAMWTMLLLAIPMVQAGKLDGVYLAMLALAAVSGFEAVLTLPAAFQALGSSLEAGRRLFEIVEAADQVVRPSKPALAPKDYSLAVKNLSFRYNESEPLALQNISFTLRQGQTLALVGPSGAGKSTLANLLLGFWDYQHGQIRLAGHELCDYSPEQLREMIGVVSQNTHLFNTTIRENLLIARPGASQAEIEQACRQAQLHDFIVSLPQGYNTKVGEQGLGLSGGERQRLALARALLKDAPILILDEATSNLDTETEREVLNTIFNSIEGRTTIIITHRLVGLEKADEILVLEQGEIAEHGKQQRLLELEGRYWRIWQLQHQKPLITRIKN
jgi:ATP-binding cassette subfamily C protein CydC